MKMKSIRSGLGRSLWLAVLALLLTQSTAAARDRLEQIRRYTRAVEFDFASWTADAGLRKLGAIGLRAASYLREPERSRLAVEYAQLVDFAGQIEARIVATYADLSLTDPAAQAAPLQAQLAEIRHRQAEIEPLVEETIQEQVAAVLAEIGLGGGGMPVPPVSFHFTQLPLALIVSPREVIREDANLQLDADLDLSAQVGLEDRVEQAFGVSALVVPIGGIGTYPTMVQESGSLEWVAQVVAHEWTHNYLTLRPLGLSYESGPDQRTMNETAASLMGTAVGLIVLERFYPELVPAPAPQGPPPAEAGGLAPTAFDFRAEMHATRVQVDALLAEGRIDEAEAYMADRRQVFFDHGYPIRRLNQAYFAFYGAYADEPGGAAGEDPVGAAVRELWSRIGSPAEFLRRISWMNDFEDLQEALDAGGS
jgi:hypothetical protein